MAAGSQKWNGTVADLVTAPASTSIVPTTIAVPLPGSATTSDSRYVPLAWPMTISPTSIARPPAVVRMSAWLAARRAASRRPHPPISRNEKTVVSSQNT